MIMNVLRLRKTLSAGCKSFRTLASDSKPYHMIHLRCPAYVAWQFGSIPWCSSIHGYNASIARKPLPARKPARVMVADVFESILALLPCKQCKRLTTPQQRQKYNNTIHMFA